jgi:hypothetical protein
MMNISGFTQDSLNAVEELLFYENPNAGKCGQKKLREQQKTNRTPAQEAADDARAQAQRGKDRMSSATRSAAAKKAAETRSKCKGNSPKPETPAV